MPSNPVKFPEKPAKEKNSHGVGVTVFSAVILGVIIVTFIGAPVVTKVTEGNAIVFGTYDGIPIQYLPGNAFDRQVQQLKSYFEQQFQGANIDLQRQLVWRQAFEQTAVQIALQHEAEKAGMVITDAQIDKTLVNLPDYQKNGKFSEELYRSTPAAEKFRNRQTTRSQLLIQYYVMDRTQGALLSDATRTFIADMAYPQRKFSFVTFTDADFPAALVADYAAKNKNLFRTIDVSKITVNSEGDAQKVREEAVKGDKTFADLAKTYSKDAQAESGGALGVKRYYDLKNDITKAADLDKLFSLTKGAISSVIAGDKVWTIYKVNAEAADADISSADTLAVVRAYIAKSERGLLEDNLETQAKTFSADAKTNFAAAAKKLGKTVETTGWVALNFGNHDLFPSMTNASKNRVFSGLAANEDFFKRAFRLATGEVSDPILASPAVLVVRADEIKTGPAKDDTPVLPNSVDSAVTGERSQVLERAILTSPKLADNFQSEYRKIAQQ